MLLLLVVVVVWSTSPPPPSMLELVLPLPPPAAVAELLLPVLSPLSISLRKSVSMVTGEEEGRTKKEIHREKERKQEGNAGIRTKTISASN